MEKIEEVKNFWDRRPCNLRHSKELVGTKKYFDQVEARKYFVEPHIPGFANFDEWKGKDVLELGCGLGTESINFARAGANLTIVELSPRSLELCKQRFNVYGLTATFILGNCEQVADLVDKKFDLVWSFGVIHHTPQPSLVIKGIEQVLKHNGELRIMLYSKISYKLFWAMHNSNQWDMGKASDVIRDQAEAQQGCPVAYTYTFDDIEELLENFEILDMRKDHIFTWDIPSYIEHKYVKDDVWKNVGDAEYKKFCRELGWHTLVRAIAK